MDPVGPQAKIPTNEHAVRFQKLLDGGGEKSNYGDEDISGTFKSKMNLSTKSYKEWSGTVKGDTKHSYGEGAKNDPD